MNEINKTYLRIKDLTLGQSKIIDFWLLLFLIGISNSIYTVKFLAIFILTLFLIFKKQQYSSDLFNPKQKIINIVKSDKTVWFYLTLIIIALINLIYNYSLNYLIVVVVGIMFWICNLLIHRGAIYFTNTLSYSKVNYTVKIFVSINLVISIVNLVTVMITTKSLTPYAEIDIPPYGVMSGDLIQGLFAPDHLANGVILTFICLYFFLIKNYKISFLALLTVLLESSNLSALIICFFMILIFILSDKNFKYRVILFMSFMIVFYLKINPINFHEILKIVKINKENTYADKIIQGVYEAKNQSEIDKKELRTLKVKWKKEFSDTAKLNLKKESSLQQEKRKEISNRSLVMKNEKAKLKIEKYQDDIKSIREANSRLVLDSNKKKFEIDKTPGAIISLQQTANQLKSDPKKLLIGSGSGNSSSYLAIMSSKFTSSSRIFDLILPKYEHEDFKNNNGALWRYINTQGVEYHSITHYPYNTYNTLFGEYGILGFLAFIIFYILPKTYQLIQLKKVKLMLIIIPLFLVLVGTYYWFESFILILFFELIIHNETRDSKSIEK